MKLSPEGVRECRQLWLIAGAYLGMAEGLKGCPKTHAELRAACAPGDGLADEDGKVLLLSAHLCSAAIRLASLSEKLGDPEVKACRAYFKAVNSISPSFLVTAGPHLPSWLHVMLRDDVAHEEESKAGYELRRSLVSKLQMSQAYAIIVAIRDSLERVIRKDHAAKAPEIVG